MGFLDDFNKLHISIKSMLLSIISIIPFYFVAIYLFDYKILKTINGNQFFINDFHVLFIFSLCFVLSLTWVINNVFLSIGVSIIGEKLMKSKPDIEMPFVLTFFYSICYLTIAIIINYYFTNFSLKKFVFLSHSFLFLRLLCSVGVYFFMRLLNKV